MVAELRQLGGAVARRPERHGALPRLEGAFAPYAGGLALDEDMALASLVHANRVATALEPWSDRRRHLNFEERPTDAAVFYDEDAYARLRAIKAQVDPRSLIHANHSIES
jgi:berberine-like enzyme